MEHNKGNFDSRDEDLEPESFGIPEVDSSDEQLSVLLSLVDRVITHDSERHIIEGRSDKDYSSETMVYIFPPCVEANFPNSASFDRARTFQISRRRNEEGQPSTHGGIASLRFGQKSFSSSSQVENALWYAIAVDDTGKKKLLKFMESKETSFEISFQSANELLYFDRPQQRPLDTGESSIFTHGTSVKSERRMIYTLAPEEILEIATFCRNVYPAAAIE